MPPIPDGVREGIVKGLYRLRPSPKPRPLRVQLLGSGTILREALRAQELLEDRFQIAADVWSATSYGELRRDALAADRWNRLHPDQPPRAPYCAQVLGETEGPIVAATDYLKAVPHMIAPWAPRSFTALGTDGFGRSDTRPALRRFFEVDAEHIAAAALSALARDGKFPAREACEAMTTFGLDPDAADPATADLLAAP